VVEYIPKNVRITTFSIDSNIYKAGAVGLTLSDYARVNYLKLGADVRSKARQARFVDA